MEIAVITNQVIVNQDKVIAALRDTNHAEVARRVGCTRTYISFLASGKKQPSMEMAGRIVAAVADMERDGVRFRGRRNPGTCCPNCGTPLSLEWVVGRGGS
jgi:transcriptional regulator with XRE-family HTH domain